MSKYQNGVARQRTAAIVDGILELIATGSVLGAALIAPNLIQVLDKPLAAFLRQLDKRSREREIKRVLYYMKQKELIATGARYEHGIKLTKAGRKRLAKTNIETVRVVRPVRWDKKWRLVFYDIPEKHKIGRDALASKLRQLGFLKLQRSVWVFPHPCREQVATVTGYYKINRFVSYIETDHIDQAKLLKKRFKEVN